MPTQLLIADDNIRVRRLVKDVLKSVLDVVTFAYAGNGWEVIRRAHQAKPDLIILDVSMPDLDGIQAAKLLKREMPEVPIVLFTMHNLRGVPKDFGVDAIVKKTDTIRKLRRCVQALLRPAKSGSRSGAYRSLGRDAS